MAKYTVLDFAVDILRTIEKPLVYQDIWSAGKDTVHAKKLNLKGKTPWQTLGARLFIDVRDNPDSQFIKVGRNPARFFLKARQSELSPEILRVLDIEQRTPRLTTQYAERDLHALLAYFAFTNTSFNRGKSVYTKTVHHQRAKKGKPSEWVYPDMVGFYLPLEDWTDNIIEFNKMTEKGAIKLYSFELKKRIERGNYREAFFQAVSNSSWANEGYLVASDVQQDDDLLSELERLSSSFGIGIIALDLDDIDSSSVLFPARRKENLDWELMNKLCEQNDGFADFIDNVRKDYEVKTIHAAEYENIMDDPELYIKKLKRGKTKR